MCIHMYTPSHVGHFGPLRYVYIACTDSRQAANLRREAQARLSRPSGRGRLAESSGPTLGDPDKKD